VLYVAQPGHWLGPVTGLGWAGPGQPSPCGLSWAGPAQPMWAELGPAPKKYI